MTGITINGKTLWRMPQQGKIKGVCAGLANWLNVPVVLVRTIVVLSLFFGLFAFTFIAYFILSLVLEPMPTREVKKEIHSAADLLNEADKTLSNSEKRLQEMERYVTSETYNVRHRFQQL